MGKFPTPVRAQPAKKDKPKKKKQKKESSCSSSSSDSSSSSSSSDCTSSWSHEKCDFKKKDKPFQKVIISTKPVVTVKKLGPCATQVKFGCKAKVKKLHKEDKQKKCKKEKSKKEQPKCDDY